MLVSYLTELSRILASYPSVVIQSDDLNEGKTFYGLQITTQFLFFLFSFNFFPFSLNFLSVSLVFSVASFYLIFCFQFNCPTFDVTQSEWWDAQLNCKVDFLVSVSILLFLSFLHIRGRIEKNLLIIPAFVYWELKVQSQIIFGLLVPDHPKVLVHSIWFLWTETIIVNDQVIQVESIEKKRSERRKEKSVTDHMFRQERQV